MGSIGAGSLEPSRFSRTAVREDTGKTVRISLNPLEGDEAKKRFESAMKQYEAHFKKMGWLDYFYLYLSDEATEKQLANLEKIAETAKKVAPGLKIAVVGGKLSEKLIDLMDSYTIMMNHFSPAKLADLRNKGKRTWWYTCGDLNNPALTIPHSAVDVRIYPWMNWKWKVSAILNWGAFVARYDKFSKSITINGKNYNPAGDGQLFYEDEFGVVQPSLRACLLRDGLEDYEYFKILESLVKKNGGEVRKNARAIKLLAIPDSFLRSQFDFNRDPRALRKYRNELAKEIESLQSNAARARR
jgi:hypothetical protein